LTNGIDIGIRYGAGAWVGLIAEKLLDEMIFPVCSPQFYKEHQSLLNCKSCLTKLPLIHDVSMETHSGFMTWDKWLTHWSLTPQADQKGLKINNSAAVLQATAEGQGIALARSVMVADDLKTGRLISLFPDMALPSSLAYYVVYRADTIAMSHLMQFKEWLFCEAKAVNGL